MITKTIHTVHRFIPLLIALFCVSLFAPNHAHAAPLYEYTPSILTDQGGGSSGSNGNVIDIASTSLPYSSYVNVKYITVYIGGSEGSSPLDVNVQICEDGSTCVAGGSTHNISATSDTQTIPSSAGFHTFTLPTSWTYSGSASDIYIRLNRVDSGGSGGVRVWGDGHSGAGANHSFPRSFAAPDVNTYIALYDEANPPAFADPCDTGNTRICSFTPENGTIVPSGDVNFTLDAWLNAQDLEGNDHIRVFLHNVDQNVLLLGFLSNSDIILLDRKFYNGEDGHFAFSTTTPLADGNYRIEAYIDKTVYFGWFVNPFAGGHQDISKQFIVGTPTFIGNLTQNGFSMLNGALTTQSATSSAALVAQCNPLGNFNVGNCLAGLFIPDSGQVNATIQGMRDGILTRLPWGYFTRFAVILGSTATTSLPSFTVQFAQNTASDTTTLAFNPGDMLAGGGALVDSIRDPYNNKSLRDIFEPIVQLMVGIMVLFTIVADITGSHNHDNANSPGDIASKRRRT